MPPSYNASLWLAGPLVLRFFAKIDDKPQLAVAAMVCYWKALFGCRERRLAAVKQAFPSEFESFHNAEDLLSGSLSETHLESGDEIDTSPIGQTILKEFQVKLSYSCRELEADILSRYRESYALLYFKIDPTLDLWCFSKSEGCFIEQ